ncbi:hypothetical protein BKA69DRAFT_752634 [Paraphysoderma sedebokerense]|nr:hypothetical protein BKA69DRAFT_752634 [Paraphysoderma sedebokerense]
MLQGEQEASLQSYFQSDPLPFSVSDDPMHNSSHVFQPHSISPTVGPEGELIHPQNDVVTDIMNLRTLQLDPQTRSNFVNALANSAALRSRLSNPPSPISHLSTRKRPSSHPPILNQVYNSFCGHCKQRLVEILKSLIYNNVEDRKMISELCVRCLRLFFNIPKKVILMEQYLAQQLKPLGYLPEAYLYELLTPPKQSPKPLKDVFLATDNPTHSSWPESTSASSFFTTLRLPDNVFDEVDRLFAVQPNSVNLELADNVPLDIFSEFTKVAAPSSPSCLLHQIEEKERAEKERIEYEKRRKEEEEESRKRMLTNNMFRIDSGACLEFKNSDFVLPSNEGMQSFHTDIPHQPEIFSSPAKAPSVNEFEHEEDALNNFAQPQPVKRKRGRPPSKNKKLDSLRRNSMPVKLPSQWDAISSELDAQLSPTKTTAQTKRYIHNLSFVPTLISTTYCLPSTVHRHLFPEKTLAIFHS